MIYEPPYSYPIGAPWKNRTELLPPSMESAGWRLLQWWLPDGDPWVLYDAQGKKVAEWPWEPTLEEVLKVRQGSPAKKAT